MSSSAHKTALSPGSPMDQLAVRRANLALVLAEVRSSDTASRAAVARSTGLTRPTVSSLVNELLELGLVRETDLQQDGSVGRPGRRLELDGSTVAALGLEINSRYLAACSVDLAGRTIQERRLVHDGTGESADDTIRAVASLTVRLIEHAERSGIRVVGVGVAVPGPVEVATGRVHAAPNLRWNDVPVGDLLRTEAGLADGMSVVVDNEANLAALAEWERAHPGVSDLMYVTSEAGMGAGIVTGGQLLRGTSGFSGELGHIQIDPAGARCACGRTGCMETRLRCPRPWTWPRRTSCGPRPAPPTRPGGRRSRLRSWHAGQPRVTPRP